MNPFSSTDPNYWTLLSGNLAMLLGIFWMGLATAVIWGAIIVCRWCKRTWHYLWSGE
jgi:hypothetical protein